MADLNDIPHDTNWGRITITRLGEGRSTRYSVLPQSEAKQESEEKQQPMPVSNKYTRGRYGHCVKT